MSSVITASGVVYLGADIVQYKGKMKEKPLWDLEEP